MKTIGVALASYGMSGQVFHGPLIQENPGFRMVSILERSKNLSSSRYPGIRIERDYKALLNNDEVELIIVNTPDPFHYEMSLQALEAKKHVVVEKPFVLDSNKGLELIELARKKDVLLSVFQNRRWDGDFLTIREILRKGLLGRLVEYEAHFDRYRNFIRENTWKENPKMSSGTLFNLGSHLIDQALVLFGNPMHVTADVRIQRTGGNINDAFTVWLGYQGIKVTLKASYLVREPGPRYLLHGTEGSYLKYGIDPQEENLKDGHLPEGENWGKEPESNWGILNTGVKDKPYRGKYRTLQGDYRIFYQNIYGAIREGKKLSVPAEDANRVIKVIEAAQESSHSGKRVQFTG